VSGDNSPDEAVWRELIESYELPADHEPGSAPWPDRENLSDPPPGPPGRPARQPAAETASTGENAESPASAADQGTADPGRSQPGQSQPGQSEPGQAEPDQAGPVESGPGQSGPGQAGPGQAGSGTAGQGPPGPASSGPGPAKAGPGAIPAPGLGSGERPAAERARIVRHADPLAWRPLPSPETAGEEEERYIPPPAPPLRLDPVAKGAWAALFGGPGYLLLATILGWQVTGWAALLAITAFVGGFAVVFLRLGDGPPRDDGPDNGAVV
jgi:hypothetical protein